MILNRSELNYLQAGDIIFQSRIGHIVSYGFIQDSNMSLVTGQVSVLALHHQKTVTFKQYDFNATQLTVEGRGGVHIDSHIKLGTSVGFLKITFDEGNLTMNDFSALSAHGGDLILESKNRFFSSKTNFMLLERKFILRIKKGEKYFYGLALDKKLNLEDEIYQILI